jgi:formamidopyrimidine-DNA glycosylase
MPELPEVEVLARHLRPLIRGKTIRGVNVRRAKVLGPTSLRKFRRTLLGAKFIGLSRRGKYLLFQLRSKTSGEPVTLIGPSGNDRPDLSRAGKRASAPARGGGARFG